MKKKSPLAYSNVIYDPEKMLEILQSNKDKSLKLNIDEDYIYASLLKSGDYVKFKDIYSYKKFFLFI